MPRTLCFTVDLDRDVNEPVMGSVCAASKDFGDGNSPRFSSCAKGTERIVGLLDELGIKATFFAEARALQRSHAFEFIKGHEVGLHGLDHEDFSGEKTGIHMDEGDMRDIVERSISLIRDRVGYQPKGFRTPYMNVNDSLIWFLPEYGMRYDSSYYTYAGAEIRPYRLDNGMVEIPVPKGADKNGKSITGYLWPMHEGERSSDDFIQLARQTENGIFVLATHSWHICETYSKGVLDGKETEDNINDIRKILETLMDDGYSICTMSESIA